MRNMSPRAALLLKEDLEDREARSIEEIMEAAPCFADYQTVERRRRNIGDP